MAACTCLLYYDADCALHAVHQSGVDAWIAAADKLHQAVTDYLVAVAVADSRINGDLH